jgi:DNA-binding response OmpR family regulator
MPGQVPKREERWPIRVLVVENDIEMRKAYADSLRDWGYEPLLAEGRGISLMEHARALARTEAVQVAQVDMRLGDDRDPSDILGLELLPDLHPAVCIVLTGYASLPTLRHALVGRDAFDFIGKQNAPEMRLRIADAAQVACRCSKSGTLHWHPCATHALTSVWTEPPSPLRSLTQVARLGEHATVLRILADVLRVLAPLSAERSVADGRLSDLYLTPDMRPTATAPLRLPFADEIELPDPVTWVWAHADTSALPATPRCHSHRMLFADAVQVDAQGCAWLGNFTHVGVHHALYDVVTLAVDLLLVAAESIDDPRVWYELCIALASARCEDELRPTRTLLYHPTALHAFDMVTTLRSHAQMQKRYHDERALQWGLLLEMVCRLSSLPAETTASQRVRLLAALLSVRLGQEYDAPWPPLPFPGVVWVEPATHRRDSVQQIFDSIRMAESRVVIAAQRMSRTRLLHDFVRRADVQQRYLRDRVATTLIVPVDGHRLAGDPDRMVYELLLTALCDACARHSATAAVRDTLVALRRESILTDSSLLTQRNLEHAVALLCYESRITLCFVLDRADVLYRDLRASTLATLGALRDQHVGQCCFLLGLSDVPRRLRPALDAEVFDSMFARPDIVLAPDGRTEARQLLAQLSARAERTLSADEEMHVLSLSGAYPPFITALFLALFHGDHPIDGNWLTWAARLPSIQQECALLWRDLSRDERHTLRGLVQGQAGNVMTDTLRMLMRRWLVQSEGVGVLQSTSPSLFSPLFATFIQEQHDLLWMDTARHFWRGAEKISVHQHQHQLLVYLYQHPGRSCSRTELLEAVYGEDAPNYDPQQDIDTLVKRVRSRIEPTPGQSSYRYLLTRPGGCYQLVGTELDPSFETP